LRVELRVGMEVGDWGLGIVMGLRMELEIGD
jgi:hypothetical protein